MPLDHSAGDRLRARVGRGEAAGVVEHLRARRQFEQRRTAVVYREKGTLQPPMMPDRVRSHPGRRPKRRQRQAPTPRGSDTRDRRPEPEGAIEAHQPPIRRPGHPKIASRTASRCLDAPFQQSQALVATPGQHGRKGRKHHAADEQPQAGPEGCEYTSHTSVFTTSAIGEIRWNRAMTNGAAKSQIAAPSAVISQSQAPTRSAGADRGPAGFPR